MASFPGCRPAIDVSSFVIGGLFVCRGTSQHCMDEYCCLLCADVVCNCCVLAGPMCREEIEADTGAAIEKLVPSLAGAWTCPGCREEKSTYTCTSCDVRRNVLIAATQTALPFFDSVDALFFDFLGHYERKRRGLAASVHELELYFLRIAFVLDSAEGQQLVQNSWRIREAVEHLLKVAFKGDKHFSFSSPWMDSNSKALYVLLVDKLKDKIKTLNLCSESFTFDLPKFQARSAEGGEEDWTCPVCSKLNSADARACGACGCDCKVLVIAESAEEMQNVQRIFQNAECLVFRAFDIMTDRHASNGHSLSATAALQVLRKEVGVFLRSLDVRRIEHAGWKIKCHLAALACANRRTKSHFSITVTSPQRACMRCWCADCASVWRKTRNASPPMRSSVCTSHKPAAQCYRMVRTCHCAHSRHLSPHSPRFSPYPDP